MEGRKSSTIKGAASLGKASEFTWRQNASEAHKRADRSVVNDAPQHHEVMFRVYKYIFYRLYCWASRSSWEAKPEIPAFVLFTALTWGNCLLLLEIVESCLGKRLLPK